VASLLPQHEPSSSEAGESRVRNRVREILPKKHLTRALQGSFTCRKSTTWTDGFTSPPGKCELRIFITHKNPPPSAGPEPVGPGQAR
jgi:hypothetical protein